MDRSADEIATEMHWVIGQFTRRVRDSWSEDLSFPERTVLARLDRNGPDTTAGLARWEQITPQSMAKTVGSLVDRGLVDRCADSTDGRRIILTITSAGRTTLTAGRGELRDRIATALSDSFTDDERSALRAAAPLIDRLSRLI